MTQAAELAQFLQRFDSAAKVPWLPPRSLKSDKDDIP